MARKEVARIMARREVLLFIYLNFFYQSLGEYSFSAGGLGSERLNLRIEAYSPAL